MKSTSFLSFLSFLFLLPVAVGGLPKKKDEDLIKKIKYQTSFGHCPAHNVGGLTLSLVEEFRKNRSLWDVKKKIVGEGLVKKHFLSDYSIQYDLLTDQLKFTFECPRPLMKVQIYKDYSQELYDGILVENGELFDPTYEIMMRNEKKIRGELPFLALPVPYPKDMLLTIGRLMKVAHPHLRERISEIILGEDGMLTLILSLEGSPTNAFLGDADWEQKMERLQKIIQYLEARKKVPSVVNLSNSKKVVVKFSPSF